jgi:hypothetical protein
MAADLARIRWRGWRGAYDVPSSVPPLMAAALSERITITESEAFVS